MKSYNLLQKYINDPNYEQIKNSRKLVSKLENKYFDIDIETYKGKGKKISGLYYNFTEYMFDEISKINKINEKFISLVNSNKTNLDVIVSSSINDFTEDKINTSSNKTFSDLERFSLVEELVHSNIIEGEKYVSNKKNESIASKLIFEDIDSFSKLMKHLQYISEINNVNSDEIIRKSNIGVYQNGVETPLYQALPCELIEEKLLLLSNKLRDNNSLIDIAFNHIIFELIHPLFDGNGRFGRYLIINQLISNKHLSPILCFNISKTINMKENKSKYYKGFEQIENKYNDGDCTIQIENIIHFIRVSAEEKLNFLVESIDQVKVKYDQICKVNKKVVNTKLRRNLLFLMLSQHVFKISDEYKTRVELQKSLNTTKIEIEKTINLFIDNNIIEEVNTGQNSEIIYVIK